LGNYEVIISTLTRIELLRIEEINFDRAGRIYALIDPFTTVIRTQETDALAEAYLRAQIFPKTSFNDALRAAIATVEKVNYLVSWDFRDLVNIRTRAKLVGVNIENGYGTIDLICPPELVWERR